MRMEEGPDFGGRQGSLGLPFGLPRGQEWSRWRAVDADVWSRASIAQRVPVRTGGTGVGDSGSLDISLQKKSSMKKVAQPWDHRWFPE